mmetsp:Transcript_11524/g.35802  ORF Transcript_11524/g.35802 Transcript_11524/m.35802 type:complete len:319 (-) Transcript_11524:426-1382(-)
MPAATFTPSFCSAPRMNTASATAAEAPLAATSPAKVDTDRGGGWNGPASTTRRPAVRTLDRYAHRSRRASMVAWASIIAALDTPIIMCSMPAPKAFTGRTSMVRTTTSSCASQKGTFVIASAVAGCCCCWCAAVDASQRRRGVITWVGTTPRSIACRAARAACCCAASASTRRVSMNACRLSCSCNAFNSPSAMMPTMALMPFCRYSPFATSTIGAVAAMAKTALMSMRTSGLNVQHGMSTRPDCAKKIHDGLLPRTLSCVVDTSTPTSSRAIVTLATATSAFSPRFTTSKLALTTLEMAAHTRKNTVMSFRVDAVST